MLSPTGKPFPNQELKHHLGVFRRYLQLNDLVADGEVWSAHRTFNSLQSVVRSHNAPLDADICFYVFDMLTLADWKNPVEPYSERFGRCLGNYPNVRFIQQNFIANAEEAAAQFDRAISSGWEGIMLRALHAPYKHGRCTIRENGLLKFKQFQTLDAVITDVIVQRQMREDVERTVRPDGYLERPFKKEDFIEDTMLAGFVVHHPKFGEFSVKAGKGYTHIDKSVWYNRWITDPQCFLGRHIEFSYMPHGMKDKPRHGSLVRFREDLDAVA
jgi:hypothetical protein